jgi:signal transduction histidine kinase
VQSHRTGAFSSQDVPGFQIMADQLANAIENARLYTDARSRADDLAVAYQQLKELEGLKDQFMQNVSHELRTPLTMIRGYAEMLLMGEEVATNPEYREALQIILRNSEALSELVADILSIMEVSAARTGLTSVSMLEVVSVSLANFQMTARQNGVTLVPEIQPSDKLFSVTARPDHLRRIADNLISNAIKFTPAGGQVFIRLSHNGGRVFLEVSDTGIGIASEYQERVFERVFQVDGTSRRRFGGTGLGLALVKELVESYGGRVSAASSGINRGSTFTVVLPAGQL